MLGVPWVYLIFKIFAIAYTFKVYIKAPINDMARFKKRVLITSSVLMLSILFTVINKHFLFSYLINTKNTFLASILNCIFTEINFICFWTLIINLVRYLKYKK